MIKLSQCVLINIAIFFFCFTAVFSENLSSQTLQQDLNYYNRIAAQKKMDSNDRGYILDRIQKKYDGTDVDLAPLKQELRRLGRLQEPGGQEKQLSETAAPAVKPSDTEKNNETGLLSKVLVKDSPAGSSVVLTVNGVTRHNDFILRDPDPKKPVKVILDVYGVNESLKKTSKDIKAKTGLFSRVLTAQFETTPEPVVRVSAEMRQERTYKIEKTDTEISILALKDEVQPAAPVAAVVPVPAAAPAAKPEIKTSSAKPPVKYMIEMGDVLSVSVYPAEELSREAVVQPDGNIVLPLIGLVKAKGITPEQLGDNLEKSFSKYISNPKITASIRKFSRRQIFITGETKGVGAYDYKENLRLMEFISSVGGFAAEANRREIKIYRGPAEKRQSFTVNSEDVIRTGDFSKDFLLEPGDIIEVPKGSLKVSVLGEITHPGYYDFKEDLHLLEIVSQAGGFTESAKTSRINIIHSSTNGERNVEHVNMDNILSGKRPDVLVKAGDTVYIPRRNIAKANWFITSVMPWLTLVTLVVALNGGI